MIKLKIKRPQCFINREAAKSQDYLQLKLINMNILQMKKKYLLIKEE